MSEYEVHVLKAEIKRLQIICDSLKADNEKLRELVRDIDEVADPYTWEFIGRRKAELGIEVDE